MPLKHLLSARDALNIAAQYGFSIRGSNWERKLIRDGIIEAREAEHSPTYPGRRKKAVHHFDAYMAKTAADVREDSKTYGVPVRLMGLIG